MPRRSNVSKDDGGPKLGRKSPAKSVSRRQPISKEDSPRKRLIGGKPKSKGVLSDANAKLKQAPKADLDSIRHNLSEFSLPSRMPCRSEEFNAIYGFVSSTIQAGASRAIYISGVPGTGKTATVRKCISFLCSDASKGKISPFKFVEVNGMKLTEPNQVFINIYKQLIDRNAKISTDAALRKINNFWNSENEREHVVLLVDEMDLLCTRRQQVLYQIFDWSTVESARLTVIAIANTLDLPERLLTQRVSSRLGMSRLCFNPYTFQELGSILHSRLCSLPGIQKDALEFVSRKVAAVSGDLRKAMQICRLAVDIAIEQKADTLDMKHVQSAVKQLSSTVRASLISGVSVHEQLLLRSAVSNQERTGVELSDLNDLQFNYNQLCLLEGIQALNCDDLVFVCNQLCNTRLMVACPGIGESNRKYRIDMAPDDVTFAIRVANEKL